MGAKPTELWWVEQIQLHWVPSMTNEELFVKLKNLYTQHVSLLVLYGNVPSLSVIQRITKVLKEKKERRISELLVEDKMYKKIGLEKPWHSQRIDQSEVPAEVSNWISQRILINNSIMTYRGLDPLPHPSKFKGPLDAVTRRTALWIATLLKRLSGEPPIIVWSISAMYSGYELESERLGNVFDTRGFDYYVATRPWRSFERRRAYLNAVEQGTARDIHHISPMRADIHDVQIQRVRSNSLIASGLGAMESKVIANSIVDKAWSKAEQDLWMTEAEEVWDEDDLKSDM